MSATPLLPVAVGLILGIVFDDYAHRSVGGYWVVLVLVTALALFRWVRVSMVPLLLLAACAALGGLKSNAVWQPVAPWSIEHEVGEIRNLVRVRGRVISSPIHIAPSRHEFSRWTFGGERTRFQLSITQIQREGSFVQARGCVLVTVDESVLDLRKGSRIEAFGWLEALRHPQNPGAYDWSFHWRRQGVVARLRCKQWESIKRLGMESWSARAALNRLKTWVRGLLTDDMGAGSEGRGGLLEAMVLGQRSRIDRRLNEVFIQAGCSHFLAVSGVHVAIVVYLARLMALGFGASTRSRAMVMMLATILFVGLAEPRPPILRAGLISIMYCVAMLLGRPRTHINGLAASAIALILIQPLNIFGVGFQLSFVAVAGVLLLTSPVLEVFGSLKNGLMVLLGRPLSGLVDVQDRLSFSNVVYPRWLRFRLWLRRFVATGLAVSVSAWLATLPIVAFHFLQAHPWGALNAMLVLPTVMLVMGVGFLKVLLTAMAPPVGSLIAPMLMGCERLLTWQVGLMSEIPGSTLEVARPPAWLIALYYVGLALLTVTWRVRKKPTLQDRALGESNEVRSSWLLRGCSVLAVMLLLGSTIGWRGATRPTGRLVVTFLSVGGGSATLIELPDGRALMYDAGTRGSYDVGRQTIAPFLRRRGIERLDGIYISHPNLDHFSGIPGVLEEVSVDNIYINEYFASRSSPTSPARHLLKLLRESGDVMTVLGAEDRRTELAGVTFERLWPMAGLEDSVKANDTSTVLRLSYLGHSILLTGDIEDYAQRKLLEGGGTAAAARFTGALQADVLALPHHGSVRSSTGAFIAEVGADYCVRSSHERTSQTLSGLSAIIGGCEIWNTADLGAVQVTISSEGVEIDQASQPHASRLAG